ncbi:GNAT family N-acetyltransferase [Lysinibacillus sp. NPDC093197]|uniref:GNAT family N-acetyltransferase n=1 Tax=Lysinibacillus sp. NPDC093197 TaxID=3364132 RepID=UPI003807E284
MIHKRGIRVSLRTATIADLEEIYYWKYVDKTQAAKKWNGPYIPEKQMTKTEFLKEWANEEELFEGVPNTLVMAVNDQFIGVVGAYWVDKNTNWLETGIVTYNSDYWNGGYGSEAYSLWIDYLFENTTLHRLGMSTWSGNERMMRVADKLGMQLEAKIRDARMVNGKYYDAIKMGILRSEWELLKVSHHSV